MSKYGTGVYLLKGFDRLGAKMFTRKAESQNLIGAQHEGINAVNSGECFSFVVMRVMHNSMSKERDSWA